MVSVGIAPSILNTSQDWGFTHRPLYPLSRVLRGSFAGQKKKVCCLRRIEPRLLDFPYVSSFTHWMNGRGRGEIELCVRVTVFMEVLWRNMLHTAAGLTWTWTWRQKHLRIRLHVTSEHHILKLAAHSARYTEHRPQALPQLRDSLPNEGVHFPSALQHNRFISILKPRKDTMLFSFYLLTSLLDTTGKPLEKILFTRIA